MFIKLRSTESSSWLEQREIYMMTGNQDKQQHWLFIINYPLNVRDLSLVVGSDLIYTAHSAHTARYNTKSACFHCAESSQSARDTKKPGLVWGGRLGLLSLVKVSQCWPGGWGGRGRTARWTMKCPAAGLALTTSISPTVWNTRRWWLR